MSEISLKFPKKIKKVEIIKSYTETSSAFLPFDEKREKDINNGDFEFEEFPSSKRIYFYEENSLPSKYGPIQISLNKLNSDLMSLEDVKSEIQHAYEQGFSEADQLTRKTFEIELEKREHWIKKTAEVINDFRTKFSEELLKIEETLVPTAILIAKHILQREVTIDESILKEQVRKAVRTIDKERIYKIHVHPYFVEILNNVKSGLVSDSSKFDGVEIVGNENVAQGSCIIETSGGTIDASFEAQLNKIGNFINGLILEENKNYDWESGDSTEEI